MSNYAFTIAMGIGWVVLISMLVVLLAFLIKGFALMRRLSAFLDRVERDELTVIPSNTYRDHVR